MKITKKIPAAKNIDQFT